MEAAIERQARAAEPEVPYAPSWVDHLTGWVDRLPIALWRIQRQLGSLLT